MKHVIATCSSGLCNRLLCHFGSLRVANELGRELLFAWPQNDHLPCAPNDLFENDFHLFAGVSLEYSLFDVMRTVKVFHWEHSPEPHEISRNEEADILFIRSFRSPAFHDEPDRGVSAVAPLLRQLQPVSVIQKAIDGWDVGDCIGVHIRKADNGDTMYGASTLESFQAMMDAAIDWDDSTKFFLATDVLAIEQQFSQRYGQRVLSLGKMKYGQDARQSPLGMVEAVIDLFLLSRCRQIIGTVNSSFTDVAGMIGDKTPFIATERAVQGFVSGLTSNSNREKHDAPPTAGEPSALATSSST